MSASSSTGTLTWTRQEDKSFENAIAMHCDNWDKVASLVTTRTLEELKHHYQLLVDDVAAIEAGHVPLPCYNGEEASSSSSLMMKDGFGNGVSGAEKRLGSGFGGRFSGLRHEPAGHGGKGSRADQERKKGIPWTEEEHRLFLLGLDKFGKGDWRSISRNYVQTRTPTQVASHAQKYFIRLNSMNRDRRRSSIHDITSVNGGGDVAAQHPPITGQNNAVNQAAIGPPLKHRPPPSMPGFGMYGAPMGHPVAAPPHMASAVGTPVMLSPGHHHPPPYMVPVAYPMAPPTMHQ